jgi:DNA-binding winged helix-turn-helix (wHTH) protein/tetratricopeptide (TPR) repeat protein
LREASWLDDGSVNLLYFFDGSVLDTDRRELRRDGLAVDIEPQVFDLLEYLIRHRERVVSRDELIEQIWGGRAVSESALSTRINAVRNAIGDSGTQQRLLKTLPRKGIRFVGEAREEQKSQQPGLVDPADDATIEERQPVETLPALPAIGNAHEVLPAAMVAPVARTRVAVRPASVVVITAVVLLCCAALAWGYFAQSARAKANVETAARLSHIAEKINMTSREDYDAARHPQQWAVSLDPQNASAQARLTFAIVTGVLNHWSDDVVTDLHAADLALQAGIRIAPDNKIVRGAQCHILRAMRQFESAITFCSEVAKSFPDYPFLHKEIGYNKLMLGELDEALAEFREADRIAPDAPLRWSWNQGMGLIYLMRGEDEKAVDLLSRAAMEAPNAGHPAAYLASAYALVGREQEARDALAHYLKLWPKTSLDNFGPMVGTAAFNGKMERVIRGLRLAGLPEHADAAPPMTSVAKRADRSTHSDESHDVR